jgi:hypothetical protein
MRAFDLGITDPNVKPTKAHMRKLRAMRDELDLMIAEGLARYRESIQPTNAERAARLRDMAKMCGPRQARKLLAEAGSIPRD